MNRYKMQKKKRKKKNFTIFNPLNVGKKNSKVKV